MTPAFAALLLLVACRATVVEGAARPLRVRATDDRRTKRRRGCGNEKLQEASAVGESIWHGTHIQRSPLSEWLDAEYGNAGAVRHCVLCCLDESVQRFPRDLYALASGQNSSPATTRGYGRATGEVCREGFDIIAKPYSAGTLAEAVRRTIAAADQMDTQPRDTA
jgi:hypothetical protein